MTEINATKDLLLRQLDIAWQLTSYHFEGLSTDECLWRPANAGLQVSLHPDGQWRADWPEHEGYDLGPPTIAWLTWHIGFWWSMVLNYSFGDASLVRDDVQWPGTADAAKQWIGGLHAEWHRQLTGLSDDDLQSTSRTRWPLDNKPFGDIVAWVNLELMKNAAEVGYARFLYACRAQG